MSISDVFRECIESLESELTKMGYRVYKSISLRGKSGMMHDFLIVAYEKDKDKPSVLIDIYISSNLVELAVILQYFAKCYDLVQYEIDSIVKILLIIPGLDYQAKMLARKYDIMVIEAEDSNELVEKIKGITLEIAKKVLNNLNN